jgi:hypothetical protein
MGLTGQMKPLSPNNLLNVTLFPVLLVLALGFILWVLGEADLVAPPILVVIPLGVLFAWIYFAAKDTYNIYFDDEFVYLRKLWLNKKVPLTAVTTIRRVTEGMRVEGVTAWHYKITFHPETQIAEQSVMEAAGGTRMKVFVEIVSRKNANVSISIS